ncbi:MAG: alkyl sulfatase dimerization domain-containing protein [Ilumatobacteraceae bacterium]|nr:alkyl sulfatase dimerization domain-containing protein [Ilumatobacteraceae bacterium]
MPTFPKDASTHTQQANAPRDLGMDPADFERASRGLVAQHPTGVIEGAWGTAWDINKYDFIEQGAPNPDTVNPSLWRQAQLNNIHGLFEVAPKVWQARGYDISNITFIEGETGWIVIDPLTVEGCARDCLRLANDTLGERPVTAVIYTHSHTDHFGGVLGVTTQEEVDAGRCRVIAPEHFLREAISENVIAGFAMARRALYQFGPLLPAGSRQHVDCGLGKAIPLSPPGLIAPTEDITHTGQELIVDGVRVIFQLTPETEAPAEMNFFFPDRGDGGGWLCMAENCSHNMHNLIPIRGAQVRNSLAWSKYIDEAIDLFADRTSIMFASHHWPRWGSDDVRGFLEKQRDMYRYIHDQTMRFANHGHTPLEIAEMIELPEEYRTEAHTTGYYGHLAHNVKAVYQRYLSWYDGNPANLWKLPPTEVGRRYVDLAGGADALLAKARTAFDEGDYRWVAELVGHVVFDDPTNTEARELQADAFEQIGYQSESATFRNAFLTGAHELRHGHPPRNPAMRRGYMEAMTVDQLMDATAVRLKAEEVGGVRVSVNLRFTDVDEEWRTRISNRTMQTAPGFADGADATVELDREVIIRIATGESTAAEQVETGRATVTGDHAAFTVLFEHLDVFMSMFPIVEP